MTLLQDLSRGQRLVYNLLTRKYHVGLDSALQQASEVPREFSPEQVAAWIEKTARDNSPAVARAEEKRRRRALKLSRRRDAATPSHAGESANT